MTEISSGLEAVETLWDRVPAFDSRPDIGTAVGLANRLARWIQGDPIKYFLVTSGSFTLPASLPDEPRARSAHLQVFGAPCTFRTDGTLPVANNDETLAIGTNVWLTGMPTIKGFIFSAASISPCNIACTYYD